MEPLRSAASHGQRRVPSAACRRDPGKPIPRRRRKRKRLKPLRRLAPSAYLTPFCLGDHDVSRDSCCAADPRRADRSHLVRRDLLQLETTTDVKYPRSPVPAVPSSTVPPRRTRSGALLRALPKPRRLRRREQSAFTMNRDRAIHLKTPTTTAPTPRLSDHEGPVGAGRSSYSRLLRSPSPTTGSTCQASSMGRDAAQPRDPAGLDPNG